MQLVKKQETTGSSEMSDLREENEKLTQQIEDLNLQLLQQHIAKSKDFQKNPEEESLASEIGMLEVDEITMKVCPSFKPHFCVVVFLKSSRICTLLNFAHTFSVQSHHNGGTYISFARCFFHLFSFFLLCLVRT